MTESKLDRLERAAGDARAEFRVWIRKQDLYALVRVVRALDELKRTVGCPLCIDGAGEFAHSKDCPLTYFEEARDE